MEFVMAAEMDRHLLTPCTVCRRCKASPRMGLWGEIDKWVATALFMYDTDIVCNRRTLHAAADIAIRTLEHRCFVRCADRATAHALCPELSPDGLGRLERSRSLKSVVDALQRCDDCQVFKPESFPDTAWYETSIPACGCCSDGSCGHGRGHFLRYYPNGDSAQIGGAEREPCSAGEVAQRQLSWKNWRRDLLAAFLKYMRAMNNFTRAPDSSFLETKEFFVEAELEEGRLTRQHLEANGPSEKVPSSSRSPALRFAVGDQVECRVEGGWKPGKIVKHWYRARDWAPGDSVPYQVKLDSQIRGQDLIFVPEDLDKYCRRPSSAPAPSKTPNASRLQCESQEAAGREEQLKARSNAPTPQKQSMGAHSGPKKSGAGAGTIFNTCPGKLSDAACSASPRPASGRDGGEEREVVLLVALHEMSFFEEMYASTLAMLENSFEVREATTSQDVESQLKSGSVAVVVVTDAGICDRGNQSTLEALSQFVLQRGGAVILFGQFGAFVEHRRMGQVFATFGLGWQCGSYCHSTANRNPGALLGRSIDLPDQIDGKATHLSSVPFHQALYMREDEDEDENEEEFHDVQVAWAQAGRGHVGYLGDVNAEPETDEVLAVMCAAGAAVRPETAPRTPAMVPGRGILPPPNASLHSTTGHRPRCCYFLQGKCKFGVSCRYSHDSAQGGPCNFGASCVLRHGIGASGAQPAGGSSSAVRCTRCGERDSRKFSANQLRKHNIGEGGRCKQCIDAVQASRALQQAGPSLRGLDKLLGAHGMVDDYDYGYDGYSDDSDDSGYLGFTSSQVQELLCQGVKPWDEDAWDVLAVLEGDYY